MEQVQYINMDVFEFRIALNCPISKNKCSIHVNIIADLRDNDLQHVGLPHFIS